MILINKLNHFYLFKKQTDFYNNFSYLLLKKCYFSNSIIKQQINEQHENEVRVRFAPSPTGKLHIGGLRTAFYNYLFARKYNGKFFLRIEDTDQDRYQKDSIENIIESLKWAGIEPDYGPQKTQPDDANQGAPWLQSKRLDIYHEYVKILLDKKNAYYCFCDEARLSLMKRNAAKRQEKLSYDGKCKHLSESTIKSYLNEGRPYVIRFKLEDKEVSFDDLTTGDHRSNPFKQEGDFVIIKSDKFPTYHYANVVDDHLMRITHVLRGQEWQLSTAKHILMYEAFGWQHPVYGHLPLICNPDGTKISKRQNDIDVLSYKKRGYMPETVLAYLSTIGGGFKINILDEGMFFKDSVNVLNELTSNFDETKMSSRPVKLNQDLLDNLNRRFIKLKLKSNENERLKLVEELKSLLKEKFTSLNKDYLKDEYLLYVLEWSQDRCMKVRDLIDDEKLLFLWSDMSNFSPENDKNLNILLEKNSNYILNLIILLKTYFLNKNIDLRDTNLNEKIKKDLNEIFKTSKKQLNNQFIEDSNNVNSKKAPNNWQITRLMMIGSLEGPPVIEIFNFLGKENVLYRLNVAENILNKKLN